MARTAMRKTHAGRGMSSKTLEVLEFIKSNPWCTKYDIAKHVMLSSPAVETRLATIENNGTLLMMDSMQRIAIYQEGDE